MFESQGIGRDVFWVQIENSLYGGLPGLESLLGQAVNQVEIYAITLAVKASLAGRCHSFDHIKEIMCPFEHAQFFGICRLDSVADTVNSKLSQFEQVFVRDCS